MIRLVTVPHSGTRFMRTLLVGIEHESHHTDDLGFPEPYHARGMVIVPARDPMLGECSRLCGHMGGLPVSEWAKVAPWHGHERVHFFRVDCPEPERDAELSALSNFVGHQIVTDWQPVGVTPNNGLRAKYECGQIPRELEPAWNYLRDSYEVGALFRSLGYDLAWM